ncbi:MAG: GAF domain-containing sensor histidine kinase [Candidatus Promineifilaceae bacterium]|nr:GAF domain-containing sensor histidine kinase [Candidatus Promineifilaceae bacterium]
MKSSFLSLAANQALLEGQVSERLRSGAPWSGRLLVYGLLALLVPLGYVALAGVLRLVLPGEQSLPIEALAAALIAALFQPTRRRLQRWVNRLIYGHADDPIAILSQLTERLATAAAPDAVLPALVQTLVESLRLPYAALALKSDQGFEIVAVQGRESTDLLVLPLVHQEETIGRLILGTPGPDRPLATPDLHLLENIARQASAVAHEVRLTADLERSRRRLQAARQAERRRLQRDLHDGLGPKLATLTLYLDTAANALPQQPALANERLQLFKQQTQAVIADIRRLVHDLRPADLDQLGLLPALRQFAAGYDHQPGLAIMIDGPESLPELPAAVEVAAYRIALEAITNVIRHAEARHCEVRLQLDRELLLTVTDDGRGLSLAPPQGVGLASMRERAAELGGECRIEPLTGGGTRVVARLPLIPHLKE